MFILWFLSDNRSQCPYHKPRNSNYRNKQTTKYKFQKHRNRNYRNTGIQKYKLQKYQNTSYRNTNDRNTEI